MQHALFEVLTSWQTRLNRGGSVDFVLINLSKAYDCLKDDLFLAQLQAYGLSKNW